jgi:hypothetical protein
MERLSAGLSGGRRRWPRDESQSWRFITLHADAVAAIDSDEIDDSPDVV